MDTNTEAIKLHDFICESGSNRFISQIKKKHHLGI